MSLSPELTGFFNAAAIHFRQRKPFAPVMEAVRSDPQLAEESFQAIQLATVSLNEFMAMPDEIVGDQQYLLRNAMKVREIQRGKRLRTPAELLRSTSKQDKKECLTIFAVTNVAMSRGEIGLTKSAWDFHTDPENSIGKILDIGAIGIYGSRLALNTERFGADGQILVTALCEMIAIHGSDTRMYESLRKWYVNNRVFSDEMAFLVNGDADAFFENGTVLRSTPNFQVRMQESDRRSIVLEPLTPKGNGMLLQAASVHHADSSMVEVKKADCILSSLQFHVTADFSPQALRVILGGYQEKSDPGRKTIPSIDRMEAIILSGNTIYTPR